MTISTPQTLANTLVSAISTIITMKLFLNDLPHMLMLTDEYRARRSELTTQYGSWAVGIAESACPINDDTCVEREAASLLATRQARHLRRRA